MRLVKTDQMFRNRINSRNAKDQMGMYISLKDPVRDPVPVNPMILITWLLVLATNTLKSYKKSLMGNFYNS